MGAMLIGVVLGVITMPLMYLGFGVFLLSIPFMIIADPNSFLEIITEGLENPDIIARITDFFALIPDWLTNLFSWLKP